MSEDLVYRLRKRAEIRRQAMTRKSVFEGKPDRIADLLEEAADEVDRLQQVCRNVYEVWAGSEGIPMPETAAEGYLLSLVEQMRDEVKEGLKQALANLALDELAAESQRLGLYGDREWFGLTDKEITDASDFVGFSSAIAEEIHYFARHLETKLKEKNT